MAKWYCSNIVILILILLSYKQKDDINNDKPLYKAIKCHCNKQFSVQTWSRKNSVLKKILMWIFQNIIASITGCVKHLHTESV